MTRKSQPLSEVKFNPTVPKHSKAFLLLSSELGKLGRTPNASLNWDELDQLCQRIFLRHGYDLHTGAWFCLIQLRLAGWAGAAKAMELLASALSFGERYGREVADIGQQRFALEWFISNVITPMYTQATDDAPSLSRAGAALDIISRQSKKLQVRSADMLDNLCYFLQVRSRTSQSMALDVDPAQQIQLVCKAPAVMAPAEPLPVAPQPENPAPVLVNDLPLNRWRWLAAGALAATLLLTLPAAGWWLFMRLAAEPAALAPFSALEKVEQLFQDPALGSEKLSAEQINKLDGKLQALAQRPASWLLQQGNNIAQQLAETFPDNPASVNWNSMLKQSAEQYADAEGWFEVQRRLNQLEQRLLESEKKQRNHITISELKTEVYEMKQALQNMPTPVSALLLALKRSPAENNIYLKNEIAHQYHQLSLEVMSINQIEIRK